jgi:hypothetical protein
VAGEGEIGSSRREGYQIQYMCEMVLTAGVV